MYSAIFICVVYIYRVILLHVQRHIYMCGLYLQGDIATCAGTYLYVWSINGEEIACVDTAPTRSQQILCLAMSQV